MQSRIAQLTAKNEAFIQENTAIAELCLSQGIKDERGKIPNQPVQYLIQERVRFMEKMGEEGGGQSQLAGELEEMKMELGKMREIEKQKLTLEKQVCLSLLKGAERQMLLLNMGC